MLDLGIDEPSSESDIEILADAFSLACGFSATYLQVSSDLGRVSLLPLRAFDSPAHRSAPSSKRHASSTTIREGLAMHEAALTFALLSPEEEVVDAAVVAFKRRDSDLTSLIASIRGTRMSELSAGLELQDAQRSWKKETAILFPSQRSSFLSSNVRREAVRTAHLSLLPPDASRPSLAMASKVLSSRPAASRAHAFAFRLLYEKWEKALIPVRTGAVPLDSREFVGWR